MIPIDDLLNQEQAKVVREGNGPCLVLAGAGSGKTRTITYRVAYLLEQGIKPESILMLTFTNKAAREMSERIIDVTEGNIKLPWAGTFHSVALKMLKKHANEIGYSQNFTILDSADANDLLKICVKEEGVEKGDKRFPSANVVGSLISYARNSMKGLGEVIEEKNELWLMYQGNIERIENLYRKRKKEANVMDFDDLLENLLVLLTTKPDIGGYYSHQFKFVLVDEYQDTNKIQASIIFQFAKTHKNILVVGDDAQSIYSFRAAEIRNILDFEVEYPGTKIFRLETNYRSTPEILAVANEAISYNTQQYEKALRPHKDSFALPEVRGFADQREEAVYVVERMMELMDEDVPPEEIAVLFRASFHSQAVEMELVKQAISYEYRGGTRFFERSHVKDILAFLRAWQNPTDVISWNRIFTMQVGIGAVGARKLVEKIIEHSRGERVSSDLLEAAKNICSTRARIGMNDLISIWKEMEENQSTVAEMIRAITDSKYSDYLEAEYPNYKERQQDLEQLAVYGEVATDLHSFLTEATLQESYRPEYDAGNGKIVLSTIHQAKGLEWEAVFVIHTASGQFPNDRSLSERKGVEEERRLFYVALTRAKKYLHITYPMTMSRSHSLLGPSMFIEDLSDELVERHQAEDVPMRFDSFGGGSVFGHTSSFSTFTDPSDDIDDVTYEPEESDSYPPHRKGRPKGSLLMDI